jgi:hypothetical protein
MFLLARDPSVVHRALSKYRAALEGLPCGPIATFAVGRSSLGWFAARPADNLHVYRDGFIVGKLSPGEARSLQPILHGDAAAPREVHPLVSATLLEVRDGDVRARPFHITNVFRDDESVSDMQLLIADAKAYRPWAEGVALLGTAGYLPGNMTLFAEVAKIPLFHAFDRKNGRDERVDRFTSRKPDDSAMVERLASIVPTHGPAYLGFSGGCDSRFVLGLLLQAGVRPQLLHLTDFEDPIVRRVAAETDVPITIVTQPAADPDPARYTLMTDAQIYFRGGHYGRLRHHLTPGSLYYTGLFADSLIKNAFRAAWKVPRRRRDMLERLIEHALLPRMKSREPGLSRASGKSALRGFLRERLALGPDDGPFERAKELAAWFYFSHRGVRWTPATLADLSFHAEPVLPLADMRALELGIRSSAWSNFHNDRVRALTHRLVPQVRSEYSNGQRAEVSPAPRRAVEKLGYEYGARAIVYLKGKLEKRGPGAASGQGGPGPAAGEESPGFRKYFDRALPDLLSSGDCSYWVKRAAITVNSALGYLEDSARPEQVVSRAESIAIESGGARSCHF